MTEPPVPIVEPTYLLQMNSSPRSEVWRVGDWVYKKQPKTMCDTEIYFLNKLWSTGYVPWAEREDLELLKIAWVEKEDITERRGWLQQIPILLTALKNAGVRHGDLSEYSIIPKENRPVLVDFGESRRWNDPMPDKRPEGDAFWLKQTMEKMVEHMERA